MLAWGARNGIRAFVLALPLLGCGGKSSVTGAAFGPGPGGAEALGPSSGGRTADGAGGVGGRAQQGDALGGAGFPPSAAGGSASAPDAECTEEACRLAIDPKPRWVTKLKGSGRGAAQIDFSGDAKVVRVGVGEQDYSVTTLNLATGELVAQPTTTRWVVASDPSGSRLVSAREDCVVSIDGSETFHFGCGRPGAVRFSSNGAAIANHYCLAEPDGGLQLETYDAASGQRIASARAELPCFYGDLNVLVDVEGRRTLFGHPERSELFVFDWETQTIDTRAIHEFAPISNQRPFNREGTVLNLALSPDRQHLVSVGAADGLALLEPDSLAVELRIPDVPFFNVYDQCYTTYLDESPVAWSRAGEILASARPGGGIALRDVATGKQIGGLDPPTDPEVIRSACSSEFGPVLMNFSPDMRSLVVLYPGHASAYSLSVQP
jgi:hypothetical protein